MVSDVNAHPLKAYSPMIPPDRVTEAKLVHPSNAYWPMFPEGSDTEVSAVQPSNARLLMYWTPPKDTSETALFLSMESVITMTESAKVTENPWMEPEPVKMLGALFRLARTVAVFRVAMLPNTPVPKLYALLGMVTEVSAHPENARLSMFSLCSAVAFWMSIRVRLASAVHSLNALSPIDVTDAGIVTAASLVHEKNASSPMVVRVSGKVTAVKPVPARVKA